MEQGFISFKEILTNKLKKLENSKNGITEISTGFYDLDYAIKGLNDLNLISIASRPAMGKTTLAFNIATHVALNENIHVAIFSLDMSREQCTNRILSSQALVESNKLNTGKLDTEDWQKVSEVVNQLSDKEIYIDDTTGISIDEIREKCIKLKQDQNIGLVVIDYLQLIQDNKCSEQEIVDVSRALKELAQELNVPIIITAQLSRTLEEKIDKRPILLDLQSHVVKNSDVVMCLYRDNYYNLNKEEKDIAEVIIAKNRYGNCGTVKLLFKGEYFKFDNLECTEFDELISRMEQ